MKEAILFAALVFFVVVVDSGVERFLYPLRVFLAGRKMRKKDSG